MAVTRRKGWKNFKVAHIVPVNCLEKTATNQYHMCLAHLVKESNEYAAFYKRMVDEGNYVMMDNGAAEDSQLSIEELVQCYKKVNPTEIVLPDTLLDRGSTISKVKESYQYLMNEFDGNIPYKIMIVAQGDCIDDCVQCIADINELVIGGVIRVNTIGISKFLPMHTGNKYDRASLLMTAKDDIESMGCEVHLLGCYESTDVIRNIRENCKCVRGVDSAFTYLCSQAGVLIDGDVSRPSGEIDFFKGQDYNSLVDNMNRFNKAVGVVDNGLDDTWYDTDWRIQ